MLKTDLTGRVVVITNADTPLGIQLCKQYAANNAKIAVCYRPTGCQNCKDAAIEAAGADAKAFALDFTDKDGIDKTGEEIFAAFGKIDILVNNELQTFVNAERQMTHEIDIEYFDSLVETAIKNYARFVRKITNYMAEAKSGIIVNITSVKGYLPMEAQSISVSIASTQVGLGRVWGSELRDFNIRSNVVVAGFSEIEDKGGIPDEIRFSHNPIKRPAKLEEIADSAMFLSGDESSFITGAVIPVDGGLTTGYGRSF